MERIGEVTAVSDEWLEVTFCRQTDCGKCHACMGTKKDTTIRVKGQAALGDAAVVEMPDVKVIKASAMAYLIPLAGLLIGATLGALLFSTHADMAGAVGALLGLGLSIGLMAVTEKNRQKNAEWMPELKEIIPAFHKATATEQKEGE